MSRSSLSVSIDRACSEDSGCAVQRADGPGCCSVGPFLVGRLGEGLEQALAVAGGRRELLEEPGVVRFVAALPVPLEDVIGRSILQRGQLLEQPRHHLPAGGDAITAGDAGAEEKRADAWRSEDR